MYGEVTSRRRPAGAVRAAFVLLALAAAVPAYAQAPGAPTGLTATAGRFHVDLSWTKGTGTVTSYQYRWKRGTGVFERWAAIPSSSGTTTSFRHTGRLSNFKYTYQVRAMNGTTEGTASSEAETPTVTRPPAPTGVTLKASSDLGGSDSDGLTSDRTPTFTVTGLVTTSLGSLRNLVTVTATKGTTTSTSAVRTTAASVDVELGLNDSGTWTITATQWPDTAQSPSSPSSTITMDVVKPTISSASYNITSKVLSLTFSEKMDASTVDLGELHLRKNGQSTLGETLTGATASTTDATTLDITLTAGQAENVLQYDTLELDADALRTDVCGTPGSGETDAPICDFAGNPMAVDGSEDNIRVSVTAPGAPSAPDLQAVSDTGASSTDNLTAGTKNPSQTDPHRINLGYVLLDVTGYVRGALVTITATQGTAVKTHSTASSNPTLEHDLTGLGDGPWVISVKQTTAGASGPAGPSLTVTIDATNPSLSSATYNPGTNQLRLTFSETMDVSTLDLSKVTIRDTDGVPGTVTLTGATAPTTDSATLVITLTSAQASTVESMGDPQLQIANNAVFDLAGNRLPGIVRNRDLPVGLPVTLSVSPNPVAEGSSATVTASLTGTTTAATTITVSAAAGTAESGDFSLSTNKTLTIAAGQTSSTGTVTISTAQDTDTDNETVTVSATASNSTDGVTNPASVTLTINDDDSTLAAPSNLVAVAGEGEVDLSWTAPTGTITGYDYSSDDGSSWTAVPGSGSTTTSYTVEGLTNGTEYAFKVRAKNSNGNGTASDTVRATPKAATGRPGRPTLSGTAGDGEVRLNWTASGTQPIDKWLVWRKTGEPNIGRWTEIPGSGPSTRTHTVTGLTNGTPYVFAVTAENSVGRGRGSSTVTVTPRVIVNKPSAPTGLTATPGNRSVGLAWTAPSSGPITSYEYSTDNGSSWAPVSSLCTPSNCTLTGESGGSRARFNNGTQYTFLVRAKNSAGVGPASNSATATPGAPSAAPGAPTGVTTTALNGGVRLSWTAPTGQPIASYDYEQDGTWAAMPNSGPGTRSFDATGLTNGTLYTFRVRARNSVGAGAASASVTGTPVAGGGGGGGGGGTDTGHTPQVVLSLSPNPVIEGEVATVIARISGTTTVPTTVTVNAAAGTAEAGDFNLTQATITIPAGENPSGSSTAGIAANQDADEDDETVIVSASVSNAADSVRAPERLTLRIRDDERFHEGGPQVVLQVSPNPLGEGKTALISAEIVGVTTSATTVTVQVVGGEAEPGDYALGGAVITIPAGTNPRGSSTATLAAHQDDDTGDETVVLDAVVSGSGVGAPERVSVTILDDDDPAVVLQVTPGVDVGEGGVPSWRMKEGESLPVRVALRGTAAAAFEVTLRIARVTAEPGDVSVSGAVIRVPAGSNPSGVSTAAVVAHQDDDTEDEVVIVEAVLAEHAAEPPKPVRLTIIDDDDPQVVLMVAPNPVEEGGSATVSARIQGTTTQRTVVRVSAAPETAEPEDFTLTDAEIVIPAGVNPMGSTMATLTAVPDGDGEDEVVSVSASVENGADGVLPPAPAPLTITDTGGGAEDEALLGEVAQMVGAGVARAVRDRVGQARSGQVSGQNGGSVSLGALSGAVGTLSGVFASSAEPGAGVEGGFGGGVGGNFVAGTGVAGSGGAVSGVRSVFLGALDSAGTGGGSAPGAGGLVGGLPGGQGGGLLGGLLRDPKAALSGASFRAPLGQGSGDAGDRRDSGFSTLDLWGGAEYLMMEGEEDGLDWDGGMFGAEAGVDMRVTKGLLAGVMVSWHDVALDYRAGGGGGSASGFDMQVFGVHPYLGWSSAGGGADVWATGGYGFGSVESGAAAGGRLSRDVEMTTGAGGGSARLFGSGSGGLRIKADAFQTRMETEGSGGLPALTVDVWQLRSVLEASGSLSMMDGATSVVPSVEAGVRHNGGDSQQGTGLEVGGGLRISNGGLSLDTKAFGLLLREDYREWGARAQLLIQPAPSGRGLSARVHAGVGLAEAASGLLWEQQIEDLRQLAGGGVAGPIRLEAQVGYGLAGPGGRGVLTPFGALLGAGERRTSALGMRWQPERGFDLSLRGERREGVLDRPDHAALLRAALSF